MRQVEPIFFPASSPESRIASTSPSETFSALATSPGDSSSGSPPPRRRASRPRRLPEPCCAIICCAIARPTAISVATPPALPPFSIPCAIWNFT